MHYGPQSRWAQAVEEDEQNREDVDTRMIEAWRRQQESAEEKSRPPTMTESQPE